MAGAQAAILDIKQKLQFEDGKSNKVEGTRVPNDHGDAMPTGGCICVFPFHKRGYKVLSYISCHAQQDSIFIR